MVNFGKKMQILVNFSTKKFQKKNIPFSPFLHKLKIIKKSLKIIKIVAVFIFEFFTFFTFQKLMSFYV